MTPAALDMPEILGPTGRAPRPVRPPLALERNFYVFEVPDVDAAAWTNGRVLAMLERQPRARWVVIRTNASRTGCKACACEELRKILLARPAGGSFRTTL